MNKERRKALAALRGEIEKVKAAVEALDVTTIVSELEDHKGDSVFIRDYVKEGATDGI